jgi:O-antigen/teichoic acid export membrane protein
MEAYSTLARTQALQGLIGLGAFAAGAYYGGFDGAIAGYLAYSLAGLTILATAIRRELKAAGILVRLRDFSQTSTIFLKFSVPVALMGVAVAPFKWIAESSLAQHAGFAALGTFYAAMLACTAFVTLASTLNAPLVSLAARPDRNETYRVSYLTLYGPWYVYVAAAVPFILACDFISGFAFGAKFNSPDFIVTLVLVIIYGGLMTYYQGVVRLVMQRDSMWLTLWTNLGEGIAVLVGAYALADRGPAGLALAYIGSYIFRVAVTLPLLIKHRIAPPKLLFDRHFLLSLVLILATGALKIGFVR